MARQTPSPKQLLTVRQAIIIFGIVALGYFAFRYGQNVRTYRQLQAELGQLDSQISQVDAERNAIDRAFIESLSPAVVEDFARREMNWVRPGDEVILTLGNDGVTSAQDAGTPSSTGEGSAEGSGASDNVQRWLELLTGEDR